MKKNFKQSTRKIQFDYSIWARQLPNHLCTHLDLLLSHFFPFLEHCTSAYSSSLGWEDTKLSCFSFSSNSKPFKSLYNVLQGFQLHKDGNQFFGSSFNNVITFLIGTFNGLESRKIFGFSKQDWFFERIFFKNNYLVIVT